MKWFRNVDADPDKSKKLVKVEEAKWHRQEASISEHTREVMLKVEADFYFLIPNFEANYVSIY
jgi:hypothetical protein